MRRWFGSTKYQLARAVQNTSYRVPIPGGQRVIAGFWESQAEIIDEQWGRDEHDYEILGRIITTYRPKSVLDLGCGSGRLFGLYVLHGISDIVGIDVSVRALALAQQRYPSISTLHCRLDEMDFPSDRFDLAVCNRVLQHVPGYAIEKVVHRIVKTCRFVYINELTQTDDLEEQFFMIRHDYLSLFPRFGFVLLETGRLGNQTYQLYGPTIETTIAPP